MSWWGKCSTTPRLYTPSNSPSAYGRANISAWSSRRAPGLTIRVRQGEYIGMVEPARARIVLRIQAEGLRRDVGRRDLKLSVQVLVHLSAATTCVQQPCASWECPPQRAFQVRPDDSLPVNRGGHFIEEPRPRRFPLPVAIPLL